MTIVVCISHTDAETATNGVDYIHQDIVPQQVIFEDGDSNTKTFTITLIDDVEPELAEQFTIVLSNPSGGSALIDPDAVSYSEPYLYHAFFPILSEISPYVWR